MNPDQSPQTKPHSGATRYSGDSVAESTGNGSHRSRDKPGDTSQNKNNGGKKKMDKKTTVIIILALVILGAAALYGYGYATTNAYDKGYTQGLIGMQNESYNQGYEMGYISAQILIARQQQSTGMILYSDLNQVNETFGTASIEDICEVQI